MTSSKPFAWPADRTAPLVSPSSWMFPVRRAAAVGLRSASLTLAQLARRVAVPVPATRSIDVPRPTLQTLEFYADAGAPEGALYADGELVGYLPGVHRL